MNKLLIILTIVLCITSRQINVMTTLNINEDPFSQDIVCTDCQGPVQITAEGLPDFMQLDGNNLRTIAQPVPGQYHVALNIQDGAGQTARVLVVLLCENQKGTGGSGTVDPARTGDTIISIYSPQLLANLTSLLMNPDTLTENEVKIQTILAKQAAINNKIANLLILIRRYSDTNNQNQQEINRLTFELEQIMPVQSNINTELLELENRLINNRNNIKQLIDFIKQARKTVENQIIKRLELQIQYEVALNATHDKNSRKNQIEAILQLRREMLKNITTEGEQCQQDQIDEQNQLVDEINAETTQINNLLLEAENQITDEDDLIADLRRQLEEAEDRREAAMKNKYEFMGNLTTLQSRRDSALQRIRNLQEQCDRPVTVDPNTLQRLQDLINQLEDELAQINNEIDGLQETVDDLFVEIVNTDSSIDFTQNTIDQAINDLEGLYKQGEQIEQRIAELKAQKQQIDELIINLNQQISNIMNKNGNSNQALKNAREELAKALAEKQENDEAIQNLLLNNLDIIRSVQGLGDYKFDIERLTNIIGFDAASLDFTNIFQANHDNIGDEPCIGDVAFYGLGQIKGVQPGKIIIQNGAGADVELLTPKCSINMATQDNYTPKDGDAICWKGHRVDGKWVIGESIIIPSAQ